MRYEARAGAALDYFAVVVAEGFSGPELQRDRALEFLIFGAVDFRAAPEPSFSSTV